MVSGVTNEMYDLFGTYQSPLGTPSDNSISAVNQAVVGGKLFHELSMGQRLTLLHSLCTSKVVSCVSCCVLLSLSRENLQRLFVCCKLQNLIIDLFFPVSLVMSPSVKQRLAVLPLGGAKSINVY